MRLLIFIITLGAYFITGVEVLNAQKTNVIDNKGTRKVADGSPDAFANDVATTAVFLEKQSDGLTDRVAGTDFVILDNGNVGIGTNTPTQKLDVAGGDIRLRAYQSTRDDSFFATASNVLVTDPSGNIISVPIREINNILHAEYVPTTNFNVNTTIETVGDFFSNELINDGAVTRSSASLLTINKSGLYDITFNCGITGVGRRTAPLATLYINGVATRVRAATAYIRNIQGANSASWSFQYKTRLNSGDTVQIFTLRETTILTSSEIIANDTSFTITRLGG